MTSAEPSLEPVRRIVQHGRSKAYRPMARESRGVAYRAGLEAYRRGDFFEAHELLEPAWMGAPDLVERDLYQGLIKLAAAYVHAVRGNPAGVTTNLRGARVRLAEAAHVDPRAGGIDLLALVIEVERRLARGPERAVERPLEDAPALVVVDDAEQGASRAVRAPRAHRAARARPAPGT
ncbi:MAG TPA: DUF309 domain-containing protein [Candidatus Dormibacteraeota bacterium]|nr:DUF309 domain-containing protein [Candidatus Dormibacteraeota bacterium]